MEQFVIGLVQYAGEKECKDILQDPVVSGYQEGWLEEQDVTGRSELCSRKTAARILHRYLQIREREPDEQDTAEALKLQDLFDCRVCTGHVMQVYVKGIIEGYRNQDDRLIFGMENPVSEQECAEIYKKLFDPGMRNRPAERTEHSEKGKIQITAEEALLICRTEKKVLLADVRTEAEFQKGHLEGAVNLPLLSILKNPYAVCERRDRKILLYCEQGYQSDIAAQCLRDAGYERVYSFAWKPKAEENR